MIHHVGAIIQHYVWLPKFFNDARQKRDIVLASDSNVNLTFFEGFTCRIDVNRHDFSIRAEISLPHLSRAARSRTYLKKQTRTPGKWGEMPLVDWKIVLPLVDRTFSISKKVCIEVSHAVISYC